MRTCTWRTLVALALLVAARPSQAGVSFGGDLGVSLNQNDQWSESARTSTTSWWFSGGLHLDASFFTPGTLDLGASASYLGYRAVGGSASDGLNYQLRVSALARTPINLSASANRNTVDFTSDSNSGRVGSTRTDSYSLSAVLATVSYPILTANFRNTSTLTRFTGTPDVNTEVTSVYAEASQSIEALNYSLTYDTNWSAGDYAETNYQNHVAGVRAQAQLATNVTAQVMASYDVRMPTLVSSLNPRYDNQALSTWIQWTASPGTSGGGGYTYSSGLFEAPGSPLRQSIAHSVSAYGSHQLSPDYTVDLNASGSATQSRLGTTEQSATGEQAGAGLRWSRQLARFAAQANVTGSLGLFQPTGAPNARAWGIGAGASLSRPLDSWYGNAGVSGSYDENTGASGGDRTRLLASVGASGNPLGWAFTSLLTGGFSRSNSPSFGASDQTHLRLDAQANRSGFNLGLNAGITDDLSEVLVPGAPPATSLVPVEFNTQSRYVTGTATFPTFPRLFLTLVGRYLSVSAPGRPDQWESGLSLATSYYVGAFSFSLYDQVTVGGSASGSTGTQNLLFLSVTRSFGR